MSNSWDNVSEVSLFVPFEYVEQTQSTYAIAVAQSNVYFSNTNMRILSDSLEKLVILIEEECVFSRIQNNSFSVEVQITTASSLTSHSSLLTKQTL